MATRTTVEITLPAMGESVTEGTVLEWRKQVGDRVEADEPIVDVSTDKVDAEVPAPASGVLTAIHAQPDEVVAVGQALGEISVDEGAPAAQAGNGGDPAPAASDQAVAAQAAMESDARPEGELVAVVLPEMGDSVSEGTLIEWLVKVGDTVQKEQGLAEISTDKVDAELPSPAAGIVAELLVDVDQTIPVGTVLCRITAMEVTAAPQSDGERQPEATPIDKPATPTNGDANATPVAARIAADRGVDLSSVPGSGPRGRVTKDDVLAHIEGNGKAAAVPAPAPSTFPQEGAEKPLRGPAATLARFMDQSRTIPTATSFRTLEVDTLDSRRGALKAAGKKISFTHVIAWAIVKAAQQMPVMAHSFEERDGKPFRIVPGGLGLGLAVDVERKDGTRSLVVPVIHGADSLTFDQFAARYDELVVGARDNTLPPDAYSGANITLTNPGGIGTVASVPRLMPGQGTIIAAGALGYPAGLKGRAKELGVSKVMTLTSTYDHRVIQGAESGQFLKTIDGLLQGENGFYEDLFASLGVTADGVAAPAGDDTGERRRLSDLRIQAPGAAEVPATAADPVPSSVMPAVSAFPDEGLLQAVQAATSVVKAFRMHGHLAADLDPLGSKPPGDPALDPDTVNLTPLLMEQIPARVLRIAVEGETFADALPQLTETYCGTIAYEIEHISDHEQRVWLRQAIESNLFRQELAAEEKTALLERLSQVEALESYLHKAFLGKKQFSIEGLDVTVPMLDEALDIAARRGARELVIGMAHRGRLNVLAHTVGRPYEAILAEFEGEQKAVRSSKIALPKDGTGDVKYHHGASGTYTTRSGKRLTVTLSPNPSHLEFVDPVVEGRARADQTSRKGRGIAHDPNSVVPLLIHGDAAFPGQGTVAETLNMQSLRGYATGGTVHLITNNQIGFTTEPGDARSTRYASDLAKGFDVPIIHVNADDVEACIAAIRLAMAFRDKFSRDAVIDLIGYRRFGHNETDEPAYTQPEMYEKIKKHPPVRKLYAQQLVTEGVLSETEAEELAQRCYARLSQAHAELKEVLGAGPDTGEYVLDRGQSVEPDTKFPREGLSSLNEQLIKVPEGFNVHRKLKPQLEKRREVFNQGSGIDWAHAESLAFASLLVQGTPIRLTGQDVERGTFSQRHLVLHDAQTGERHTPIKHLPTAQSPFELHNSPLSEQAALGFEYGYSVQAPEALVLWEAQFGDFVNGAQVIIDQFIASGLAKWGQTSRLTLLLPHGYEGSGPEHSSGRLERFLQLCAEGNMRVANTSTPAQYFHLLRRQALVAKQRPLVVMTPKSLLRHASATSSVDELANGTFQRVLDDTSLPGEREEVTRLCLCSGKIYYDLAGHDERQSARHVAIGRVELLYPFPAQELQNLFASYPNLREIVWVQEEPKNMGARSFMKYRLDEIRPDGVSYDYVGRELRASPGEGYAIAHRREQDRIVRVALGDTRLYRDARFLGPLGTA